MGFNIASSVKLARKPRSFAREREGESESSEDDERRRKRGEKREREREGGVTALNLP